MAVLAKPASESADGAGAAPVEAAVLDPAISGIARRPGGPAIGRRWATDGWAADAPGASLMGTPRPGRRAPDSGPDGPGALAALEEAEEEEADPWAPGDSGLPRPAGGVAAAECSAQRLTVRAGGVPRAAEGGRFPVAPGAETIGAAPDELAGDPTAWRRPPAASADGAVADAALADGVAPGVADVPDRERCPALVAGACVSGRSGGVTVAAEATDGIDRTGASAPGSDQASASSQAGAAAVIAVLARRWTGIGALDVRRGTALGLASTRPAGAAGPVSWPSACTIGGRGWCPDTCSRNAAAGATTGGPPIVRWIGGSCAQACVGAAGPVDMVVPSEAADDAGPSGASGEGPSDGVLRPKGHGRRTGVTPPRTGAC